MRIAVRPYGNEDLLFTDDILIFIPESMSVRWVPTHKAFTDRIESQSYRQNEYIEDSIYKCLRNADTYGFAFRFTSLTRGCDELILNNETYVKIEMPYIRSDENIAINNTPLYHGSAYADILYVYKYADYYVLRMILTYMSGTKRFFTVVLSKTGVVEDFWFINECKSALSLKIDTLMRY